MRDAPVLPALLDGWREQPYFVESLLVAIVSASAMVALRSHDDLRRNQHELAITLDSIGDGVIAADVRGRVIRMNPVAQSLTGWRMEGARGKPLENVFHILNARTREPVENPVTRVLKEGRIVGLANQTCLIARDGTEYQIADSAAPLKETDGRMIGAVMVFRDVTGEYEARTALEHGKRQLEMAQQLVRMGNWSFHPATEEVNWSQGMYRIFGCDPANGPLSAAGHYDIVHPEDRERCAMALNRALQNGEDYEIRFRIRLPDGEIRHIRTIARVESNREGNVERVFGATQDITDQIRLQEENSKLEAQFHQAQKLESVGRLAGGVAHDLNNLLAPMLGYAEMLLDDFSEDDPRRTSLEEIFQSGLRARDLVHQLLAFSRKQVLAFKSVDLNGVLARFEKLLRRTVREDVELKIVPGPSLPHIRADLGQMEQVIMNLAVNAQDAMPDGGVLTIETQAVELDDAFAADRPEVAPGPYVMMRVSDTGGGMDAETRARVFEPFFTTKAKDKGTGLGLATVYGIVKQHGGHIWVDSEPGNGTTFKVYLPAAESVEAPMEAPPAQRKDLRGGETILLVEDNEQVRELTRAILHRQGYHVLVAENGEAALAEAVRRDGRLDLLLTDVVMPGINGRELYDRISAQYPRIRVLYMSGYTEDVVAHRGVMDEGVELIQKPFAVKTLAAKVRDVLDRA